MAWSGGLCVFRVSMYLYFGCVGASPCSIQTPRSYRTAHNEIESEKRARVCVCVCVCVHVCVHVCM